MLSKFLVSIISFCVTTILNPLFAATNQQINKRIEYFQEQINQFKIQKKQSQNKPTHRHYYQKCICPSGTSIYHISHLGIGPYLNTQEAFDVSTLIINTPTIRADAWILLNQYQLAKKCSEMGIPTFPLPQITFSGKLEGQVGYKSTYSGSRTVNINFSGAELDTYVQKNLWVSGYISLDYDPNELVNGSDVFINRAFLTIGNLNRFPFYISIGQVYVPFGRYNSLMISSPVTLGLGRTRARAVTVGYQTNKNTLHAEIYGYQELTNNLSSSNQNNQWGMDIGYEFNNGGHVSGEVGASLISNLADSEGMQSTVFLHNKILDHNIQAINFYGSFSINTIVFIAEYVGALRSFDISNDIGFTNQSIICRPTAFHTEANYTFHIASKVSSLGFGYDHTVQSLALGLPQKRYSIFYNVNIWRDTNFALEYRHDVNYSRNSTTIRIHSTHPFSGITDDFSKSNNVVMAQFDLYF